MVMTSIAIVFYKHQTSQSLPFLACVQILFSRAVDSFSTSTITNCHKHSGFKQYKFIFFRFWGLEAQPGSHWPEPHVAAGLRSSLGALGLPFPSPPLKIPHVSSWLVAPPLAAQPAPLMPPSLWSASEALFYIQGSLWSHWAHPNGPGCLLKVISLTLIPFPAVIPLWYIMYHICGFQALGCGHFRRHDSAHHRL